MYLDTSFKQIVSQTVIKIHRLFLEQIVYNLSEAKKIGSKINNFEQAWL